MSVLVTGVAGFIGYHVARVLAARGEEVIGVDDLNDYYDPQLKRDRLAALGGAVRFTQCDFADEAALEAAVAGAEIDRIVHLGAQAGVRYSLQNPRAYVRSNLAGHVNMLELARARGVKHLVYASSSSVYGGNTEMPFRVEDRVDHPVSLYAATKKADELMSETYAHLFRIPQTGLRFFTVYGPWGRPDMALWLFTSAILEGRPIAVFNHGKMQRDFTYIDDIVDGVIAVLDRPPARGAHEVYNIGDSQPVGLMEMISTLETALGVSANQIMRPMQPGDVTATYADISKLNALCGYQPKAPLKIGLEKFVAWWRQYENG